MDPTANVARPSPMLKAQVRVPEFLPNQTICDKIKCIDDRIKMITEALGHLRHPTDGIHELNLDEYLMDRIRHLPSSGTKGMESFLSDEFGRMLQARDISARIRSTLEQFHTLNEEEKEIEANYSVPTAKNTSRERDELDKRITQIRSKIGNLLASVNILKEAGDGAIAVPLDESIQRELPLSPPKDVHEFRKSLLAIAERADDELQHLERLKDIHRERQTLVKRIHDLQHDLQTH